MQQVKRRKTSTRKSTYKKLTRGPRYNKYDRSTPSLSLAPYSSNTPHYFKRMLDDGVFYTSALGTISCVNATGTAPAWLTLGAVAVDQGGVGATGQWGFSISPQLFQVVQSAEFTTLFQQYQLLGLQIKIESIMGDSFVPGVAQVPTVYIAEDFNDSVPPATFQAIQANDSVKEYRLNQEANIVRYARPCLATPQYAGVAAAFAAPSKDTWVDCTGTSSQAFHYVFKGYIRNWIVSSANTGVGMRITPTLYFRCRGNH